MTGTSFSVTEASRCTPPRKMMAQMTTSTMPTTQDGHAESGLEGGADGVGLDHAAHEAQGQDDGHGEETSQELAESRPGRRW